MSSFNLRENILSKSVAAILATGISSFALAEEGETVENEETVIYITGVRGSIKASINKKRFASTQVDGIAAEDIGKLPDITIADSLQRITGVQIERTAGEGGPVAIRGLPQVSTSLNGEVFLSAMTIDSSQTNFGDLPSQLFSGVDVYKSGDAVRSVSGISGSVDLHTRRPFDMDEGSTFSFSADVTQGTITKETDPTLTGLYSYNADKWGVLVSVVSTEVNLATDYNGYFDTSEDGGIGAAHNNFTWGPNSHGTAEHHVVPQGLAAFSKEEERKRKAIQFSFQADLGEGFEVVAETFYSEQERFNNKQGLSQNNRWDNFNDYAYPTPAGFTGDSFTDEDGTTWAGINAYNLQSYRLQSFTQVNNNEETALNSNFELNYDNGGALTGQVRITRAKATAKMRHGYGEGDILSIDNGTLVTGPGQFTQAVNCINGEAGVGANGGCYAQFAPGGIEDIFDLTYDASGEHPVFGGFDQIVNGGAGARSVADYMADLNSYHVGAFSSEGNTDDEGEINTFSTKWNYAFEDSGFITSVDFGLRLSERTVDHDQFTYTSNFGDGCDIAQWKAVDQYMDTAGCEGNPAAGEYLTVDAGGLNAGDWAPYTLLPPTRLDEHTSVSFVTDFGPVSGVPGVWVIDPSNFRNPRQFHLDTFGNVQRTENGGATYDVKLDEFKYFLQANFESGNLTGNLGLKVIKSSLYVKQNIVGGSLPHSGLGPDIGDAVTERKYTDYLPSLNLAYDVSDDVKLRFAYSENQLALNLSEWGGGKTVGRVNNADCNCLRVVNGTLTGNPGLNPWRSNNYSFSTEWYNGDASMTYFAAYKIDIESFTTGGSVMIDEPDADGIRRGPWPFETQVQGKGGNVNGIEVGTKVAFSDFSDIDFLSNIGVDLNYTFSDNTQEKKDVQGNDLPFDGMSRDTYNFTVWYEKDDFSTRMAWNSISPRLITTGGGEVARQALYQDTYSQLDVNATYHVNDDVTIYINGSNITEEFQQTYLEFKSQKAFQNIYEARWTLGARATF